MSGQLSLNLKRSRRSAIAIMHETAAEFRKPVLLYLIEKDSSVNVDTTWKFRDMIAFRDQRAKATRGSHLIKRKMRRHYRAARHVLERHNSGARPTPIIGLGADLRAVGQLAFVARNTASEAMFTIASTPSNLSRRRPHSPQSTSALFRGFERECAVCYDEACE